VAAGGVHRRRHFFAISGFVVCASLAASRQHDVLGYVSTFYARRLARIVPALVVVLVVTSTLATLFIPREWLSTFDVTTVRYAYFGLSNWVLANNPDTYFDPRAELNPYTHTLVAWS
jgi:peptidoglycan/LPS O-acetylase OafA/YrhL